MHRESIYLCTYARGSELVVGRVRAWDIREAAQLFAVELESEEEGRRVGPREVKVLPVRLPSHPGAGVKP